MNDFNSPKPPQFPDPLKGFQELQKELVEALGDLFAEQEAQRGVIEALAKSHPEPERLAEAYLAHMDLIAEHIRPEQIGKFRSAAQRWRDLLLQRTGQAPRP